MVLAACSISNKFSRKLELKIDYFENALTFPIIVCYYYVGCCPFCSYSITVFLLRRSPYVVVKIEQSTGCPGLLPPKGIHRVNTSGGKSLACLL